MRTLIAELRAEGLCFQEEGPPPSEGPLAGRTLVLTGTLPQLVARAGHRTHLRGRGGSRLGLEEDRLSSSPARAPGSKLEKAERLGVAVLDEAALRELIGA